MERTRHRTVETNGIRMHVAESGPPDGPVVLLCHGFPESWYSWRHQLVALGDAGYRAVAPDMRGYGSTDAPADERAYSVVHHVGDLVGLLDEMGTAAAAVVGHDWGAPVAWSAAAWRPDRFAAVASLSVPWSNPTPEPPVALMRAVFGDQWFYFLYFQEPGVAEAELDADPAEFLRGFFHTLSGDAPGDSLRGLTGGEGSGIIDRLVQPDAPAAWLTGDDVAYYAAEFERTGFRGGLSWYRCADLTWELSRAWADVRVHQPALFIAGERDAVLAMTGGAVEAMAETVPGLQRSLILPGCGHWTQQERPTEVNEALLDFLADIPFGPLTRGATRTTPAS